MCLLMAARRLVPMISGGTVRRGRGGAGSAVPGPRYGAFTESSRGHRTRITGMVYTFPMKSRFKFKLDQSLARPGYGRHRNNGHGHGIRGRL